MLSLPPSVRLFVATAVVDGRRGPDSLMALVRDALGHDIFEGHLFHLLHPSKRSRTHHLLGPRRDRNVDEADRVRPLPVSVRR